MRLSDAISAYIIARQAEQLSPNTINDYRNTCHKLLAFCGDIEITDITADTIIRFFACQNVSRKTCKNYHSGLACFWQYCVIKHICPINIIRDIPSPRPNKPAVLPYDRKEVEALLLAAAKTRTSVRDYTICLLLLDTGIRASELCGIRIKDLALLTRNLFVTGKGEKSRIVKYSPSTQAAINEYIWPRKNKKYDYVFLTELGEKCNRHTIRQLMDRIGQRAGVPGANCHRWRHTFATEFLRNNGNIYALQALLGHESLDMVRRYAEIVESDIEREYDKASPVLCWGLEYHGSHP